MNEEKLREQMKNVVDHFRETYGEDRKFEMSFPVYYLFDEEGEFRGMAPVTVPPRMWTAMRESLRNHTEALEVGGYVFVMEAWGNEDLSLYDEASTELEGKPGTFEMLLVTAGTKEGDRVHEAYAIERAAEGNTDVLRTKSQHTGHEGGFTQTWDLWPQPLTVH